MANTSATGPLLFDDLCVGQSFGRFDWEASRGLRDAWLHTMGETLPADALPAGRGTPFPPGLLLVMFSNYMDARVPPRPPGMIYAKQALTFGTHPAVGDVLTTAMTVHDKYLMRGRRIVELATTTHNQRGEPVVQGLRTVVWSGEVNPGAPLPGGAAADAGGAVTTLAVTVTPELVHAFTALAKDRNATHYDDSVARAQGFPSAIVHGAVAGSIVLRLLMQARARLFAPGDEVDFSFVSPVHRGDTITARGRVTEAAGGRSVLEVACANQEARMLIAATARLATSA